jgi:hypothetical protein
MIAKAVDPDSPLAICHLASVQHTQRLARLANIENLEP